MEYIEKNEESQTIYTITTTDKSEALDLMQVHRMKTAIRDFREEVLRPIWKYDAETTISDVIDQFYERFHEFDID